MIRRRTLLGGIAGLTVGIALAPASAAPPISAAERLNALGTEMDRMAGCVGLWDVTETVWGAPGTEPAVTTGLVAERSMMGSLLQEIIRRPSDVERRAVARTDLLTFDRVEGVWQYASFDMRFPVGLMTATGPDGSGDAPIDLLFTPFAVVLPGTQAVGRLRRMRQTIRLEGPDRDVKDQYFTEADGSGVSHLGHRYAYKRRS